MSSTTVLEKKGGTVCLIPKNYAVCQNEALNRRFRETHMPEAYRHLLERAAAGNAAMRRDHGREKVTESPRQPCRLFTAGQPGREALAFPLRQKPGRSPVRSMGEPYTKKHGQRRAG